MTHPIQAVEKLGSDIVHGVKEAITHPVITAELAAAPFTGGASLLLVGPTELALHHRSSAALNLVSAIGASTTTGQKWIHEVVDPINQYVGEASAALTKLSAPITSDIRSISGLVNNVNDHLIAPIAGDIQAVVHLQSSIQQAQADDLHHGILGMLRFARDVSGSLTSADSVLARSNQQLGEDQLHVAEQVQISGRYLDWSTTSMII